jgi:hypothetical protein
MIPRERAVWSRAEMPVTRYFFFVGGVLLALLFVFDAYAPKPPAADRTETGIDLPVVRIHSDRKWPAAVVFDTSVAAISPADAPALTAKADTVVPARPAAANVSATARVRAAFAQLEPAPKLLEPAYPKRQENKPQPKRKIVKSRVAPPTVLVAQQPRFGFFANN